MNREQRERLVDGALARALGQEKIDPRDGFEQRLLANLAAQPEPRPWWRWRWIPTLAAATVLAIAIVVLVTRTPAPQVIETKEGTAAAILSNSAAGAPHIAPVKPPVPPPALRRDVWVRRHHAPAVVAAKGAPLPKQDVFPAPLPLTEQERLLLALVRHQPAQARMMAEDQQAERDRVQKYFETGEAPAAQPTPAQDMR